MSERNYIYVLTLFRVSQPTIAGDIKPGILVIIPLKPIATPENNNTNIIKQSGYTYVHAPNIVLVKDYQLDLKCCLKCHQSWFVTRYE